MNTIRKRAIGDEKGKVLILVLVLLVVGGLVLTPLLGLASTGLTAGQVYEKKTAQLYAADAGVEDGIWKILNAEKAELPDTCGDAPWENRPYDVPDVINGNDVQVSIEYLSGGIYRIMSTASDDESHTTVESYVETILEPKDGGEWDEVLPGGTTYEGGNIEKGYRVYVDGNLTMDYNIEDPGTFVYVRGDLTMTGDEKNNIEMGAIVYVEGNLHLAVGIGETGTKVCIGGNATIPKVETGAQLYVEENLTVTGKIEDATTTVCVGGNFEYGSIEGGPTIHATGFEPFDDCPICCWDCIQPEFELVVDVLTYEVGAVV